MATLSATPLRALEIAVATYSTSAVNALEKEESSSTWETTWSMAKSFVDGRFFDVLSTPLAEQLLAEDEAEFLKGDDVSSLRFQELVAMLRLRTLRALQAWEMTEGSQGAADSSARQAFAYKLVLVAASLVALYSQQNITGPEIKEETLAKHYPPPLLRRACDKPFAPSAATSPAPYAVVTSAAPEGESAGTDASRVALLTQEEREDLQRNDKLLQRMTRDRDDGHSHMLYALTVSGDEPYDLLQVPGYLLAARALFVALTRPPPGASTPANVLEECKGLWSATDSLVSLCWWGGRAAVFHQRALVEKEKSHVLLMQATYLFSRVARELAPEYQELFIHKDVFNKRFCVNVERQKRKVAETLFADEVSGQKEEEGTEERKDAAETKSVEEEETKAEGPVTQEEEYEEEVIVTSSATAPPPTEAARADLTLAEWNSRQIKGKLLLEWGLTLHFFDRTMAAKGAFHAAQHATKLWVNLTGVPGRRTKFQSFDITQLKLEAYSFTPLKAQSSTAESSAGGVRYVKLDEVDEDNVLLERIQFTDGTVPPPHYSEYTQPSEEGEGTAVEGTDKESETLTILDQNIVLALCLDIKNMNPMDGLTREEMRPYIARVLERQSNWMTYSTALFLRSMLEYEEYRTRDRALLQMQALLDQYTTKLTPMQFSSKVVEDSAPAEDRLRFLSQLSYPGRWEMKRQLADKYRAYGVLRSALDLYEELELWDDIIETLITLEKPKRAEKLLRARLERIGGPGSAKLWCLLGTVVDDDEPFLKSWEVSNGRYGRAKLSLGQRKWNRGDVKGALMDLSEGLRKAPHFKNEWFLLGVAAMRLQKWEVALQAFTRVVQMDNNEVKAWGNMGAIYLRLHNYERAYPALEQALRADRANWQVLSNFLTAAVQTRQYSRVVYSCLRLLELRRDDKANAVDVLALTALIEALEAAKAVEAEARTASAVEEAESAGERQAAQSVLPTPPPTEAVQSSADGADTDEGDGADNGIERRNTIARDHHGNLATVHMQRVIHLFAAITSVVSDNAEVWGLYARLNVLRNDIEKEIDCLKRRCRVLQSTGWERSTDRLRTVWAASRELLQRLQAEGSPRSLLAAKMHLRNVLARSKTGSEAANINLDNEEQYQKLVAIASELGL